MILDEATSALDSRSENAINTTLARLLRDQSMTTISIAHRKSTIEKCDDVLVLGYDGSIVEEGKYDELYSNKNSRLYRLLNETSPSDIASEDELQKRENERKRKEEEALRECETKPTVLSKAEVQKLTLKERSLAAKNFSEEGVEMNDEFGHKLMIPHHVGTEEFIMHAAADREEAEKIRIEEEENEEKRDKKKKEKECEEEGKKGTQKDVKAKEQDDHNGNGNSNGNDNGDGKSVEEVTPETVKDNLLEEKDNAKVEENVRA